MAANNIQSHNFQKDDIFRCRKCRRYLFEAGHLKEVHERKKVGFCYTGCSSWYMRDEGLLSWIQGAVNQAQWTEGKIYCPKCSGRIGAFDFIHGVTCSCEEFVIPAIWIQKSRVDHVKRLNQTKPNIRMPSDCSAHRRLIDRHQDADLSFDQHTCYSHDQAVQSVDMVSVFDSNSEVLQEAWHLKEDGLSRIPASDISSHRSQVGATVSIQHKESTQNSETLDGGEHTLTLDYMPQKAEINQTVPAVTVCQKTLLNKESSQDETPVILNDHTCPVCLDLLYEPFSCSCGHIFCDPCLRQLNIKCKQNSLICPLCRQTVKYVSTASEIRKEIRTLYPDLLRKRHKSERRAPFRKFPLPGTSKPLGTQRSRDDCHVTLPSYILLALLFCVVLCMFIAMDVRGFLRL